ncbi:hypothetical protein BN85400830 [Alteracholeplasma palmae J233]|uniref:Uncharacterized protein n=1 Tax=Alteracholeplasma palmae (strain ATCC 49389 / J233) TaxID=1318466 RepID=U4KNA8_ALTPJ|nr:hypothetical protein [Alteracholeplasma palmae]CCV63660.1 hypothetical protein BN85400830 [Alteracholeplasma palmae J233]
MNLVLERNASIFGSIYKEKKLPKKTLEAMASELVIPEGAIEMTYDEMEYVDGGFWNWLADRAWSLFDGLLLVGLGWLANGFKTKYGTLKGLYSALKAAKLGKALVWLAGTIKTGVSSAVGWVIANPLVATAIGLGIVATVVGAITVFL